MIELAGRYLTALHWSITQPLACKTELWGGRGWVGLDLAFLIWKQTARIRKTTGVLKRTPLHFRAVDGKAERIWYWF